VRVDSSSRSILEQHAILLAAVKSGAHPPRYISTGIGGVPGQRTLTDFKQRCKAGSNLESPVLAQSERVRHEVEYGRMQGSLKVMLVVWYSCVIIRPANLGSLFGGAVQPPKDFEAAFALKPAAHAEKYHDPL